MLPSQRIKINDLNIQPILVSQTIYWYVNPFPTYNKSASDDFKNTYAKLWYFSIRESLIIEKN